MAKDLVKDVRFLQVIQFLRGADEGGDREALAGQQLEKGLKGNQRRHPGDLPAGGRIQHTVDFAQLGDAVMGQCELFDAVQILLASAAVEQFQLTFNQGLPNRMFAVRIVDVALRIRFAGNVLSGFHLTS